MSVHTNNLKKGTKVLLSCGWEAILRDNMKGTIRIAEVFGFFTETGSIYTHDIVAFWDDSIGNWNYDLEYPKDCAKVKAFEQSFFN